jgi:hypothetical protein
MIKNTCIGPSRFSGLFAALIYGGASSCETNMTFLISSFRFLGDCRRMASRATADELVDKNQL